MELYKDRQMTWVSRMETTHKRICQINYLMVSSIYVEPHASIYLNQDYLEGITFLSGF